MSTPSQDSPSINWPDLSAYGLYLQALPGADNIVRQYLIDTSQSYGPWAESLRFKPTRYAGLWCKDEPSLGVMYSELRKQFPLMRIRTLTVQELFAESGASITGFEQDAAARVNRRARLSWKDPALRSADKSVSGIARLQRQRQGFGSGNDASSQGPVSGLTPRVASMQAFYLGKNPDRLPLYETVHGSRFLKSKDNKTILHREADSSNNLPPSAFLRISQALQEGFSAVNNIPQRQLEAMSSADIRKVFPVKLAVTELQPLVRGLVADLAVFPHKAADFETLFETLFGRHAISKLEDRPPQGMVAVNATQTAIDREMLSQLQAWRNAHPNASMTEIFERASTLHDNRPSYWRSEGSLMTPLPLQVAMEKALQDYQVAAQGLEGTSRESLGSATRIRATPRSRDTLVSLLEVQEPAPAVAPAFVTAESYAYEIPATVAGGFTTRRMDHLAVMAGLAGRNPQGLGIFLIAGGTADASAGELEPEFKRVLAWVGSHYTIEGLWDLAPNLLDEGGGISSSSRMLLVGDRLPAPNLAWNVPSKVPVLYSYDTLWSRLSGVGEMRSIRMRQQPAPVQDVQEKMPVPAAPLATAALPASAVPEAPVPHGSAPVPVPGPTAPVTDQALPTTEDVALDVASNAVNAKPAAADIVPPVEQPAPASVADVPEAETVLDDQHDEQAPQEAQQVAEQPTPASVADEPEAETVLDDQHDEQVTSDTEHVAEPLAHAPEAEAVLDALQDAPATNPVAQAPEAPDPDQLPATEAVAEAPSPAADASPAEDMPRPARRRLAAGADERPLVISESLPVRPTIVRRGRPVLDTDAPRQEAPSPVEQLSDKTPPAAERDQATTVEVVNTLADVPVPEATVTLDGSADAAVVQAGPVLSDDVPDAVTAQASEGETSQGSAGDTAGDEAEGMDAEDSGTGISVESLPLPPAPADLVPVPELEAEQKAQDPASALIDAAKTGPETDEEAAAQVERWQVNYRPLSQVSAPSTMIPRTLLGPTMEALARVVRETGMGVDEYVATNLGWDMDQLAERLSAEQVDATALAMWNHAKGEAMLEGDRTGVGKGRVLAAMALHLKRLGQPCMFFTVRQDLFRDIYRDIEDIGALDEFRNPLLLGVGTSLTTESGEFIAKSPSKYALKKLLATPGVPAGYDIILGTYSQFNKPPLTDKKYQQHCAAMHTQEITAVPGWEPAHIIAALDTEAPDALQLEAKTVADLWSQLWTVEDHISSRTWLLPVPPAVATMTTALHEVPLLSKYAGLDGMESSEQRLRHLNSILDDIDYFQAQVINSPEVDFPFEGFPAKSIRVDALIQKPKEIVRASTSNNLYTRSLRNFKASMTPPPGCSLSQHSDTREAVRITVEDFMAPPQKGERVPVEVARAYAKLLRVCLNTQAEMLRKSPEDLQNEALALEEPSLEKLRVAWLTNPRTTKHMALLLDESHKAAAPDSRTGENLLKAVSNAHSITYASATSIRSSRNFALYTPLLPRNTTASSVESVLNKGGVPLQEVFMQMLTTDGKIIRREQSLAHIDFKATEDIARKDRNLEWAEKVSEVLAAICGLAAAVQKNVTETKENYILSAMAKLPPTATDATREAAMKQARATASDMRAPQAFSQFHLLARLLQMASLADHAADEAIADLRAGRKPVITIDNTLASGMRHLLESRMQEQAVDADDPRSSEEATEGDDASMEDEAISEELLSRLGARPDSDVLLTLDRPGTFRDLLERYALSMAGSHSRDAKGRWVVDSSARACRGDPKELERICNELIPQVPDIPVSPIDHVMDRIRAAGFTVEEVSNRSMRLQTDANGVQSIVRYPARDSIAIKDAFNRGELDATILSRKGSTGISLHAGANFADQNQRVLIELQPAADIVERLQFWGRVDRKNQVCAPAIKLLSTGLPYEYRLQMLQNTHLRKLSANVTGSGENAAINEELPDLNNFVGNAICKEYLTENPDIATLLQCENLLLPDAPGGDLIYVDQLTSRSMLLGPVEQGKMYAALTTAYKARIEELDLDGHNPLKTLRMPARCKMVNSKEIIPAQGSDSAFDKAVYLTELQFKVHVAPPQPEILKHDLMPGKRVLQGYLKRLSQYIHTLELARDIRAKELLSSRHATVEAALLDAAAGNPNQVGNLMTRVDSTIKGLRNLIPGTLLQSHSTGEKIGVYSIHSSYRFQEVGTITTVDNSELNPSSFQVAAYSLHYGYTSLTLSSLLTKGLKDDSGDILKSSEAGMTPDLMIVSRPGEAGHKENMEAFLKEAYQGRLANKSRYVLTGNPYASAELATQHQTGTAATWASEDGVWHSGILLPDHASADGALQSLFQPRIAAKEPLLQLLTAPEAVNTELAALLTAANEARDTYAGKHNTPDGARKRMELARELNPFGVSIDYFFNTVLKLTDHPITPNIGIHVHFKEPRAVTVHSYEGERGATWLRGSTAIQATLVRDFSGENRSHHSAKVHPDRLSQFCEAVIAACRQEGVALQAPADFAAWLEGSHEHVRQASEAKKAAVQSAAEILADSELEDVLESVSTMEDPEVTNLANDLDLSALESELRATPLAKP